MTTPFNPQPCGTGAVGSAGSDIEQVLLCDVLPNGQVAGSALVVYEYDSNGNPAGPPTFVDPATGAAYVATGVLQPCPGDSTVRTLTAQARIITSATPWTPADVTGVLTSLTLTGMTGLWDLVDQSGTVLTGLHADLSLTWSVEDANTLTGPQLVTPQAGATVVANWTQR